MMIKKIRIFLIVLFVLLQLTAYGSDKFAQVKQQNQNSLVVTLQFPEPQLETITATSGNIQTYYSIEGLQQLQEVGYPRVPYLTKMFSLPAKKVSYRVLNIEKKSIPVTNYALNIPLNKNNGFLSDISLKNKQLIDISRHGLFRDIPIFALNVFPLQLDASGTKIEFVQSVTIEIYNADEASPGRSDASISARERKVLEDLFLNGTAIDYKNAPILAKPVTNVWKYKSNRYKILIDKTGIYQITYSDLEKAKIPLETFDTRKLRLLNKGQEVPIYFSGGEDGHFDAGDYFEFWGEKNQKTFIDKYPDVYADPFSDINVYWLEVSSSSGLRMADESGALTVTNPAKYIVPFAFTEKLHFEEDKSFIRFGNTNTDSVGYTMDHWFYDRGVTAIGSRTYETYLPWPYTNLSTRSVYVKAMMRGLSMLEQNHRVQIWMNDKLASASGTWHNQEMHIITNENGTGLSQSDLVHGKNDLRVVMDQGGVTDIALLNWYDVTYQRQYRADQNMIRFRKQENLPDGFIIQFEVDGFNRKDINIYKLGVSKIVNSRVDYITADDNKSSWRISFQDEIFYPDLEYVAVTPEQKKKPLAILEDTPWIPDQQSASIYDVTNQAEYLIITHNLFYENALDLKAYREQDGLAVAVVKTEDIYDEFNYGIKSPLAIKDFIKYAYANWDNSRRLLYVALVGDASYDYKDMNSDLVPTFLFDTEKYGAAASDFQYTLVSGSDQTPDLAIGRWPVSNNSEFMAYFEKLKGYESPDNIGEWRSKGLYISGNDAGTHEQYTGLPAFRAQNQRFINMQSPAGFFTRKLNTVQDPSIPGGDPNFGSTPTLIDYFDDGVALMTFLGHGGGGIWADVGLFNTNDISRLNNGSRLPFIKSMTCFTGAFESASLNGIAEELIVTPDKGAIGMFAASGVGWLHNDFAIGWSLTDYLLEEGMTIGEAVLYAKIFYLNNNVYITEDFDVSVPSYYSLKRSMVNHYNLLGDPYVRIAIPAQTLTVTVDNTTPSVGDTLSVTVQAPFASGNGRIELTNPNHEPLISSFLFFQNNTADFEFVIPAALEDERGYLKAYAIDDANQKDGRGMQAIAVNQSLLDSLVLTPEKPQVGDTIRFAAFISSVNRIDRVLIKNLRLPAGHLDTFELTTDGEGKWVSIEPIGPYAKADTLFFDVQIDDTTGSTYLKRRNKLYIHDPRPDLTYTGKGFEFTGQESVGLSLAVKNDTDSMMTGALLRVYVDSSGTSAVPLWESRVDFSANENKEFTVPVAPPLLRYGKPFYAVIDGNNEIEERNEANNNRSLIVPENLFNLPKSVGTTYDGTSNDTLKIGASARFFLAPNGISKSTVFTFNIERNSEILKSEFQPGLTYIPPKGIGDPVVFDFRYSNPEAKQTENAYLEFLLDTTKISPSTLEGVTICRYTPSINRWMGLSHLPPKDGKVSAYVNQPGRYALFKIEDSKRPVVEITVNGRKLHADMLVPQNPSLAFILQDENGVNLVSGFQVYIDNEPVSGEELNVPDSVQNANAVSLIAKPNLTIGLHTIRVEVTDAFGNYTEEVLDFRVAGGFEVQIYGNYPNPFQDYTIFSFLIVANDILDGLSIDIYTVSGRKIRQLKDPQGADEIWDPGYHELEWDGRDNSGVLVANGVYFALVKADFKGKSFEQTLKVAKLR